MAVQVLADVDKGASFLSETSEITSFYVDLCFQERKSQPGDDRTARSPAPGRHSMPVTDSETSGGPPPVVSPAYTVSVSHGCLIVCSNHYLFVDSSEAQGNGGQNGWKGHAWVAAGADEGIKIAALNHTTRSWAVQWDVSSSALSLFRLSAHWLGAGGCCVHGWAHILLHDKTAYMTHTRMHLSFIESMSLHVNNW